MKDFNIGDVVLFERKSLLCGSVKFKGIVLSKPKYESKLIEIKYLERCGYLHISQNDIIEIISK